MIEKLKKRISLIILLAISIPLILTITFSLLSYYDNIIKTHTGFIDRFFSEPDKPNNKNQDKIEISNIEGIYWILINNQEISITSENITDTIKEYALKVSKKNNNDGIIDNYIFRKLARNNKDDDITVILIESKDEINKIKFIVISTIILTLLSLTLIHILAKKISNLIVKPVIDTFNKQKDFISDASHELKTPLAVIRANADVLELEIGKNKWLNYIQNETDKMNKLISELLLLTKIENIDKLRKPEKFDISNHVELIVSSFESLAFDNLVKIETKIQKEIITNTFNKEDITHILSTLIDNAIKHTETNKKLIVELIKNKDKLIINVKNKGKEIPISEREKIFDRFYRIDKSRNRSESRYGLGLSIAKATVLKNNGLITVDYQNGYTIFKVELPI